MSLPDLTPHRYPLVWRWLIERVWRVEHAFERAQADGRAENDTRIRILVVAAVFSVGFLVMAGGAVWSATLSDAGKGGRAYAGAPERADLVDRHGRLLAANLPHYTLSVDTREVWSRREVRTALLKALPNSSRHRSTGPWRPSGGAWSCAASRPARRPEFMTSAWPAWCSTPSSGGSIRSAPWPRI